MATVQGRITTVQWRDEFTGQTEARVAPEGHNPGRQSALIRGTFAHALVPGEVVALQGEWAAAPTGHQVFQVHTLDRRPPATAEGELVFLTGYIKGMTKKQAALLLDKCGGLQGVITTCRTKPAVIAGLLPKARKVVARLRTAHWDRKEMDIDMFVALQSAGLRPLQIQALVRHFGAGALRTLAQASPYEFCQVKGIGFSTAEKVAQFYAKAQGRPVDLYHPERLIYGLCDVVAQERLSGHICAPEAAILRRALRYLTLPVGAPSTAALTTALTAALARRLLIKEFDKIYPRGLHRAEGELALHLAKLIGGGARALSSAPTTIRRDLAGRGLSEEQLEAVVTMATQPVSLLVGGPGRGKTHTLRSFVALLEKGRKSYLVLAPTGKAAKRAAEMTGKPCFTIHKACGLDREEDVHDKRYGRKLGRRDRLTADVIVVDESSMIDLALGFELVRRIKPGRTALVFVGDPDQLPPVSAGQVLRDLIDAEVVPVARLTQVFRQASGSPLIDGADALNRGELPAFVDQGYDMRLFDPRTAAGYPHHEDADARDAFEVRIVQKWLQQAMSLYASTLRINPLHEIQVYAPQRTGPLGLQALNLALQSLLNPLAGGSPGGMKIGDGFVVRLGDKVMQTRNNYRMRLATASAAARAFGRSGARIPDNPEVVKELVSIMNGQVGYVTRLDPIKGEMEVTFDEVPHPALYVRSEEWHLLAPAFAISVHKSQGSEVPYAFLVLGTEATVNGRLLNRPLIYTGWTRAKQGVAIFAPASLVARAAANLDGTSRWSNLGRRLRQLVRTHPAGAKRRLIVPAAAAPGAMPLPLVPTPGPA